MTSSTPAIPLVSLANIKTDPARWKEAADQVFAACRTVGFFSIEDYPIRAGLEAELDAASREFFRLPLEEKMAIRMSLGGKAWRGYFPVGDEVTSGKPDIKEGIYFGQELGAEDLRVVQQLPMHGANLFPNRPSALRHLVLEYMETCKQIGDLLTQIIATGLGLGRDYFISAGDGICSDPLQLFRIFHYPPVSMLPEKLRSDASLWGVGEHTDYGLLTVLKQDLVGGLQVKTLSGEWIPVPPRDRTLVINIGDMLESVTEGLFRSTPHRVKNPDPNAMRLSFPFFYDPGFDRRVNVLPLSNELLAEAEAAKEQRQQAGAAAVKRWDNTNVLESKGIVYGKYVMGKVSKVFPQLAQSHL